MKKSRLFSVFCTLSKRELRELRKMVRSPFFNQREYVAILYDYLYECHIELRVDPAKEQAYRRLFPNTPFDHPRLRLAMSLLLKLIEQFLVYNKVFEDPGKSKIQLAAIYRERKLDRQFETAIKDAQEWQAKKAIRNAEYYNDLYNIQLEQYLYSSARKHTEELNLQEISDTIDINYLTLKLRQTCLLLSHQTVYKTEYRFGLLDDVLKYIEDQGYLHIPAISVYYYCYHALVHPGKGGYFGNLKQLIFQHGHEFLLNETRDLYLLAINYCIKRLNEGNMEFFKEGLDLYKESLKNDYLLVNGTLSRFSYNNAVAMGLRIGEYEWVEGFIHKYKEALGKPYRENTFSFNLSRLEYERKNYDSALQLLQKADYRDILLNLGVKTLQLKIYYELKEYDLLESHLDSMRIFIRRKEVIGYHQTNYLNIVNYTKKLLGANFYDKQMIASLRERIEVEDILTEKNWLLEQLNAEVV